MNLSLFLIYIFTVSLFILYFFFNDTATTEIYTLSLHDALPILLLAQIADITTTNLGLHRGVGWEANPLMALAQAHLRSEEHTSELQSRFDLVCRLLLEKKKKNIKINT